MATLAAWMNACGIVGAATALVVYGLTDVVPETLVPVFLCFGFLLALFVGTGLAIRLGQYRYAAVTSLILALLIFISCQPSYVRHYFPRDRDRPGGGYHYHCIWDMAHVH